MRNLIQPTTRALRCRGDLACLLARAAEASQDGKPVRAGKRLGEAHAIYVEHAREWERAGAVDFTRLAAELLSSLDRALRMLWDAPEE